MSSDEAHVIRLRQWAMRAADYLNRVTPPRAAHLGDACEYARTYMGHWCRCGHNPITWSAVYAHVLTELGKVGE